MALTGQCKIMTFISSHRNDIIIIIYILIVLLK